MKHKGELYKKIVYWSDEDNCYIGMCPEIMYGGVHGDNQLKVFKEICVVVDEWIEIMEKDGKPLPIPKNIDSLQFA